MSEQRDAEIFMQDVLGELSTAVLRHGPLASAHEAFAVLLEEVEEFKVEVFKKRSVRDPAAMRSELVQIAAMAVRAAVDLKLVYGRGHDDDVAPSMQSARARLMETLS